MHSVFAPPRRRSRFRLLVRESMRNVFGSLLIGLGILWAIVGVVLWSSRLVMCGVGVATLCTSAVFWLPSVAFIVAGASIVRPLRKCPVCGEHIFREAIVCRHCGRDIPPVDS